MIRIEGNFLNLIPIMVHIPLKMMRHPLVLPFFPTAFLAQSFCAVFQLLGGSHIRCVIVACFSETVSNWTVIQFSNPGFPDDILESKRRITI